MISAVTPLPRLRSLVVFAAVLTTVFSEAWTRARTFDAVDALLISLPLDTASFLNGGYPVDPQGYADFPVLGRFYVRGMEFSRIEDTLSKGLAPYLRDTYVRVRPAIRLTLLGHWQRPGMHYVDAEATVWEACKVVGGPGGEVNLREWVVMRGSQDLGHPILDAFSRGESLREAGVQSGDIFVIPTPNPQEGFWYWFRESLTVTSQIAAITATVLTTYITYTIIEERQ
jgi:protein involved in polysaccharide export with SLBB domain